MQDKDINFLSVLKSIKERLIDRLIAAKTKAGPNWKIQLVEFDPFFDTFEGATILNLTSAVTSRPATMNVDRLERVTLALEKMTGVEDPKPAV